MPGDPGLLSSEERTELNRFRKENREPRKEKNFFRPVAAAEGAMPAGNREHTDYL
jgi:hypothetical protein